MIAAAPPAMPRPSAIVHYVVRTADGLMGFQLLCDRPWGGVNSTFHARVVTEVDPVGRSVTFTLTSDPVDCMTCLVAQASR